MMRRTGWGRQIGSTRIVRGFGAVLLGTAAQFASADEGMWTFDHFPMDKVRAAYGVRIDQTWLDRVRNGAVRLTNGCSASNVSSQGLLLTNNHCVEECAQALGEADRQDYARSGYLAQAATGERSCPGIQAEILVSIQDATSAMTRSGAGLTGERLVQARTATQSELESAACGNDPAARCEMVSLYHGGQYKLYRYRKYTDVRLVFSPGSQAAFFGGDLDNFNFPRYALDAAFVRLYEGGRPATTPQHLRWQPIPPVEGEAVFVPGNPGQTQRQLTVAQLKTQRDVIVPGLILQNSELRGRLIRFSQESEANARVAYERLTGLENDLKVLIGHQLALRDGRLLEGKLRAESALRRRLSVADQQNWATIERAEQSRAALQAVYDALETGPWSDLFAYARTLVRGAAERLKPSGERLAEFTDSHLPLVEKNLLDERPTIPELEQLIDEFWLSKSREYLTADDPSTAVLLGGRSPQSLARQLAQSSLGNQQLREALWHGGMAAIRASQDPMIQFVLAIDPAARRVRSEWEETVQGPTTLATENIAKLRFLNEGAVTYPDATFTLRLSYGKIAGWNERGRQIVPFTRFSGLFDRAGGEDPFRLDDRWIAHRGDLNPRTIFNFVTTNDIVGGNSGSALINAKGEVIGTIFDGNIHELAGDYGYLESNNRAIAVSAAAVREALETVYRATALVAELDLSQNP